MRLHRKVLCAAVVGGCGSLSAGVSATPLLLEYEVQELGTGGYEYTFTLVLADPDGTWAPGMGWGWFIFGDDPVQSPIEDFEVDPDSWPVGPGPNWT